MSEKKHVVLRPPIRTKYAFKKLKYCRHCGNYTVLEEKDCAVCGKNGLYAIEARAMELAKRAFRTDRLLALLLALVALLFSQTFVQMLIVTGTGLILIPLLFFLQRRALEYQISFQLGKLFEQERDTIVQGLIRNLETATAEQNEGRSYEMTREVATLIRDDHIRKLQLILLQSFVLRKDMELELEPLIVNDFFPPLAEYIGELSKIKRELIKERAIRYIVKYEQPILTMERGEEILSGVAGAAVRLKQYVLTYSDFIARYAQNLPKDRFYRLYRMISQSPSQGFSEQLLAETYRIYQEKYQWDADFQQIKVRSSNYDV